MLRSRPALRLERNPLIIVLAQVRIPPILRVGEMIPAIQDAFRSLGYPRYGEARILSATLLSGAGAIGGSQPSLASRYNFFDRDARRGVVLSPEFVTYQTTSYEGFERFTEEWAQVLDICRTHLGPAFAERLGLRYIDFIQPRSGEHLETWLKPGLHGLAELELRNVQAQFEIRGLTPVGELVFRLARPRSGLVPGDLQPFELQVVPQEEPRDGEYAVLDFDHFSTNPRDFDTGQLIEAFWELHDIVDGAFRSAVTPEALAAWGEH